MGEVKRYETLTDHGMRWCDHGPWVLHSDYARLSARCAELERERDEARRAFERAEADVQVLVRERDNYKSVADSMGRDAVEFSAKLAEAQAELARLRAVEAAALRAMAARNAQDFVGFAEAMEALAEACGRKG